MSSFKCPTCGMVNVDCDTEGYKTDREILLEYALMQIIFHGPACKHDKDCPLNGGVGYDQGCAHCAVVLAHQALHGREKAQNETPE